VQHIAPVGSAPLGAGRWGQLDLVGETSEWLSDWYFPYIEPCVDCAYVTENAPPNGSNGAGGGFVWAARAYRGGDFSSPASHLAPAFGGYPLFFSVLFPSDGFSGRIPTVGSFSVGARCARSP
jgi:formylglycine-generating enzyme required for sulfatase activity